LITLVDGRRYNGVNGYPPVITWLAVHSTASGVAGFPKCNPGGLLGPVCKTLANIGGEVAYTKAGQALLFQIDYLRVPTFVNGSAYKSTSQLAAWNNEGETKDPSINANFAKVKKFAMIKAMKDTMVYPNEGEWWGHFADGAMSQILTMKETKWYTEDLFGLKTADEAGKIVFNTTAGDHLQFSDAQLLWWVNNYFEE
jgi:palmitoyl-protein thioesterase